MRCWSKGGNWRDVAGNEEGEGAEDEGDDGICVKRTVMVGRKYFSNGICQEEEE